VTPDDERTPDRDRQDDLLLADLRRMWEETDPVPPDLAERISFVLSLEDLEFELLALRTTASQLVSARGEERVRTVTFSGESFSVLVSIDRDRDGRVRLDGWIGREAPGDDGLEVELRCGQTVLRSRADTNGRFAFEEVPSGLVQLVFHPSRTGGEQTARTVVTPALKV